MKKNKVVFFTIILVFILSSCGNKVSEKTTIETNLWNVKKVQTISSYDSVISWKKDDLLSNYWWITSKENIVSLSDSIKNENFKKTQDVVSNILQDITKNGKLDKNSLKVLALKYIKVWAILKEWNYFYKEKQKSDEAISFIKNKILTSSNKWDYYSYNFLWYSKEIVKDYSWALDYYNKALENISNVTKDNKLYYKSVILNQIWHIYDLTWDIDKANTYYVLAENMWFDWYLNLLNRWRYEYRKGNIISADKYFNKLLKLNITSFVKAEVYYDLSSIYLVKKGWVDRGIEYAKLWIKSNWLYPSNYVWVWIWYITKWWKNMDKALPFLDKAIEIYPKNSVAYKWKWIFYYIKDDYKKAIFNFNKQLELSKEDISLMKDEKENSKNSSLFDLSKAYALNNNVDKSIYYLDLLLLNNKNKYFYSHFLAEFSMKNWAFAKIKLNKKFVSNLNKIVKLYNNK